MTPPTPTDGQPTKEPYAQATHRLRSGAPAYQLNKEDSAKGGRRAQERKRQAAHRAKMTLKELIAEKLEQQADDVIDVYWKAGQNGEWRAVDALLDRYLGKPKQEIEATVRAEAPWDAWTQEQRAYVLAQLEARRALPAGNGDGSE